MYFSACRRSSCRRQRHSLTWLSRVPSSLVKGSGSLSMRGSCAASPSSGTAQSPPVSSSAAPKSYVGRAGAGTVGAAPSAVPGLAPTSPVPLAPTPATPLGAPSSLLPEPSLPGAPVPLGDFTPPGAAPSFGAPTPSLLP